MFSSIRSKLIFLSIILVLAAVIPTSLTVNFLIKKSVRHKHQENVKQQVTVVDRLFAVFFDELDANLTALTRHPAVVRANNSLTTYMGAQGGIPQTDGIEGEIYKYFDNYGAHHPGTLYVYLGTKDGGYIQWPSSQMPKNYDPRKREWFTMGMANRGEIKRTDPYADFFNGRLLISTIRTFNADTQSNYGVVGVDVSSERLANIVKNIHVGETGYLVIVHKSGVILADPKNPAHNRKRVQEVKIKGFEQILKSRETEFLTHINEKEYQVNSYKFKTSDWIVAAFVETRELTQMGRSIQQTVVGVTLLVVLVIALLVFVLSGKAMKPVHQMVEGLKDIAQGEGDLTLRLADEGKDEFSTMGRWFNLFIQKLQKIVLQITGNADELARDAGNFLEMSQKVSQGLEHISMRSTSVASAAEEMSANMTSVASAAEQSSTNISMVSAAAEEMSTSIGEIAKNANNTRQTSQDIVTKTDNATKNISQLKQAAQEIGKVVDTINDIADQTNLLALNATIEAARAGEAGKGFAVVANEIKGLASQTTAATQDIQERVKGIQESTLDAVSEIDGISGGITQLNLMIDTVAAAVEEQSVTTGEIAGNVNQAAQGLLEVTDHVNQSSTVASEIARDVAGVNKNVTTISTHAEGIDRKSGDVSKLAKGLKQTMDQFKI